MSCISSFSHLCLPFFPFKLCGQGLTLGGPLSNKQRNKQNTFLFDLGRAVALSNEYKQNCSRLISCTRFCLFVFVHCSMSSLNSQIVLRLHAMYIALFKSRIVTVQSCSLMQMAPDAQICCAIKPDGTLPATAACGDAPPARPSMLIMLTWKSRVSTSRTCTAPET